MKELEIDDSGYQPLRIKIVNGDAPMRWLRAGWQDLWDHPTFGLAMGALFFGLCWATIAFLAYYEMGWMLMPALAGALLVGPVLATPLYRESRRNIAKVEGTPDIVERPINGPQVALVGVVLMSIALIWMRAAVIIYALFFGLKPFPGLYETLTTLFFTGEGLLMIIVGTAVGALFGAFVFAISVFSIPMLVDQDVDGFTAMGSSFVAVNRNVGPMVKWAFMIAVLATIGIATGLLGMIVIFPVLGHATWHAYHEIFHDAEAEKV